MSEFKFPNDFNITPEILIYGGEGCKFCKHCKLFLEEEDLEYTYVNVSEFPRYAESKADLFKDFKALGLITETYKTIPLVFINNEFIGGYTALCKRIEADQEDF